MTALHVMPLNGGREPESVTGGDQTSCKCFRKDTGRSSCASRGAEAGRHFSRDALCANPPISCCHIPHNGGTARREGRTYRDRSGRQMWLRLFRLRRTAQPSWRRFRKQVPAIPEAGGANDGPPPKMDRHYPCKAQDREKAAGPAGPAASEVRRRKSLSFTASCPRCGTTGHDRKECPYRHAPSARSRPLQQTSPAPHI